MNLVLLAALMGLVTYPSRALPLLAPGIERLPPAVLGYLRFVGPSVLAALAASSVMLLTDDAGTTTFHVGVEWLAVGACILIVLWRRNLLLGLATAAVLTAIARATGVA